MSPSSYQPVAMLDRPPSPDGRFRNPGSLTTDRTKLIWLLSVSMFFCVFMTWNARFLTASTLNNRAVYSKSFQVNRPHEDFVKNTTRSVKQISLIGERNSGTKWMWGHLHDCFNHSLPVRKTFSRYKHWFQPHDYWRYPHDTLVIAQFRDPYLWLEAMRSIPHHMPAHAGLEWPEFLSKPWTTPRIGLDLELKGDEMCQHHFQYKDIISCIHRPEPERPVDNRHSLDKPLYEMRNDGSGIPYDNIMELRSDKIRNILEIRDFPGVADLWILQYEYMLAHGTQQLLDHIEEWTGVKAKCSAFPPQNRPQRGLTTEEIRYINDHLNWTMEAAIGFEPRFA